MLQEGVSDIKLKKNVLEENIALLEMKHTEVTIKVSAVYIEDIFISLLIWNLKKTFDTQLKCQATILNRQMSTDFPVFQTLESVRLPFNSKIPKLPVQILFLIHSPAYTAPLKLVTRTPRPLPLTHPH